MPIVYIDAPPGLPQEKKKKLMKSVTAAIDEAYKIGDTLVFVREHESHNVSIDGVPQSESPRMKEILKKIAAEGS